MSDRTITNDAAYWAVRLQAPDIEARERQQFEQWLHESENHKEEYEKLALLNHKAAGLASMAEAHALLEKDLKDFEPQKSTGWWSVLSTPRWAVSAVAACAILAIFIINPLITEPPVMQSYQTATGESDNLNFSDGSKIILNTRTEIQVNIDEENRRVKLDSGEAYFAVAKDPERPFIVESQAGTITVLGTEFNVKHIPDGLVVSVLEGRVRVSPADISGGQSPYAGEQNFILTIGDQLVLRPGSEPDLIKLVNVTRVISWQQQQMIFEDTLLSDAVWEVNQYLDGAIEIDDPSLKGIRISGVFRTGQSDDFIGALDNLVGVRVVETKNGGKRLYASRSWIQ